MDKQEILKALRLGAVPRDGFDQILVGVKRESNELLSELDGIAKTGSAGIRFLSGRFGSGKTLLTAHISQQALLKDFVVSQVVIDPGLSLANFEDVYRAICQNLCTASGSDSAGISELMERWSFQQLRSYQSIEGLDRNVPLSREHIKIFGDQVESELSNVRNLHPALARAVSIFAVSKLERNSDRAKFALDYIRASDKVSSRDFSKELGLKGKIDQKDAYDFLRGLLVLIRETGHPGVLIVLDEVETVQRLPNPASRKKAYETLRHILDDVASARFSGVLFLITGTPELFGRKPGIGEYKALEERISQPMQAGLTSSRQPILELAPFGEEHLLELASKIRDLHGSAESWPISERCNADELAGLTRALAVSFGGAAPESRPREFIRKLIMVFDLLKEYPGRAVNELVPEVLSNGE
jgi:hypothetical protein